MSASGGPRRNGNTRRGRSASGSRVFEDRKPPGASDEGSGTVAQETRTGTSEDLEEEEDSIPYYPLSMLLQKAQPIEEDSSSLKDSPSSVIQTMSFNAEMFLRVMSLCHTVVVEKDLDLPAKAHKKERSSKRTSHNLENKNVDEVVPSQASPDVGVDGAPFGYAYQAESPDEGALVSAASLLFGYQVIGRDSSGIQIQCREDTGSSIFQRSTIVQALRDGSKNLGEIAANTAFGKRISEDKHTAASGPRIETWSILAVNKFDSDRKRMSILLRSPPELGGLPVLFCKGADVSMINPEVSNVVRDDVDGSVTSLGSLENESDEKKRWEIEQFLQLEMHLGDFARDGLRTLVLGMYVQD
jgi:phospholipid-translocating ATPase/phospholipid-transporting ATPase